MASELASMYVSITPNMSGFRSSVLKELRGVDVDAGHLGTTAGGAFSNAYTRAISGVGHALASALKIGAGAALAGISAAGAVGVKTAAQLETAQIGFTTMLGSGEKAQAFLKDLTAFAAKTPFELPGLQQSASQLVATGIATEKVIPIMTTLGNITAGMGTGSEGIRRAVVAIQQMNAAQKIGAEDLNQLRDAGIPVYELLAKATGKSVQQVAALAQAGKLGKKELDQLMATLESGVGLERFNGLMEQQSKSLSGLWSTAVDAFSIGMASAIEPVIPLLKEGLGGATQWLGEVAIPAAAEGMSHFASFIRTDLGPAINNIGSFIRTEVLPPLGQFGSFIRTDLVPGLQNFGGWLVQNKDWLGAVAVTLGTVVAAIQVWSAVTKVITAAQIVFNAVLAANPIGIVVVAIAGLVAGLTWFFTQTELGKEIWANVWGFITTVTDGFVTWFRDTAMPWITEALRVAGDVFKWLYENVVKPVWDAIKLAIDISINVVMLIIAGLVWYFQNVLAPVFTWLWQNIVKPVFDGISTVIRWAVENIIMPIITGITWYFENVLGPVFNWLWKNVIEPVWNGISTAISTVWNWIRDNVFTPLSDFIQVTIPTAFEKGKEAIGKAWEAIRDVVKEPIKFVIDTVINKGIIGAINTVRGWFQMGPLDPVTMPAGFAGGGYTGDGGKNDPAGIVHAGEFVLTKEQTARAGVRNLYALAAALNGYAGGGLVSPLSNYVLTQGFSGLLGHNGVDMAAPTGTPVMAAGPGRVSFAGWSVFGGGNEIHIDHPNGLQTWYAHLNGFNVGGGANVSQGQTIGPVGSTGLSTGPHLHYMVLDGGWPFVLNPMDYLNGGGNAGSNPAAAFINPLAGMLEGFLSQVRGAFPGVGLALDLAVGAVRQIVEDAMKGVGNMIAGSGDGNGPRGFTSLPVQVFDGGGWLRRTTEPFLVQHNRTRPDAVLRNQEFRDFHTIAQSVRDGGHGTGEGIREALAGAQLELVGMDPLSNAVAARLLLAMERN